MKLALLVVQSKVSPLDERAQAFALALQGKGYLLTEVRMLSANDGEGIKEGLTSLSKTYEGICVLAEQFAFAVCQRLMKELGCMEEGTAIYRKENASYFLISKDEQGVEFFRSVVVEYLQKRFQKRYESVVARAVGASYEGVASLVENIERSGKGLITLQRDRRYDEDVITLVYNESTPKMLLDNATRAIVDGLGDTMYALNDYSLEENLVNLLKVRGKKISVAESFTGGGVAKRITSVSGASAVYFEGINSYDERSKIKRLGVSQKGLQAMGAVSDQTAYEMALGLLNTGDCDVAVATTGLAGPKTDKSMLPVGLSYIAVGTKEKIFVYRYKLSGTRKEITEKAINYALFLACKRLKEI